MLRRLGTGVAWGVGGYILGAGLTRLLISQFSSTTHDRSVEAATTALLVAGPLVAITGFVVGFLRGGHPR